MSGTLLPARIPVLDAVSPAASALPWREKLALLTWQFSRAEQLDCPIEHRFEEGKYIRTITIPAGTLFIGRVHRHGHLCELLEGELIHIVSESERVHRRAPFSVHTTAGYQMVLYTLTDCRGRTTHENAGELRDTQALEAAIAEPLQGLIELGAQVASRTRGQLS